MEQEPQLTTVNKSIQEQLKEQKKFKWTFDKIILSLVTVSFLAVLAYDYSTFKKVHAGVDRETALIEQEERNFDKEIIPIVNNMRSRQKMDRDDFEKVIVQAEHVSIPHRLLIYSSLMNSIRNRLTVGTYSQQPDNSPITEEELEDIIYVYNKVLNNIQSISEDISFDVSKYPNQIKDYDDLTLALSTLKIPVYRLATSSMLVKHYEKSFEYEQERVTGEYFKVFLSRILPLKNILENKDVISFSQEIRDEYQKNVLEGKIDDKTLLGFNQETWDKLYAEKFGKEMLNWFKNSNPDEALKVIGSIGTDKTSIEKELKKLMLEE